MSQMTLAHARGLLSWTQSQLARECGESVSNIRDLENGENKRPAYVLVMKVVKALQRGGLQGVSAENIFEVPDLPKRKSEAA